MVRRIEQRAKEIAPEEDDRIGWNPDHSNGDLGATLLGVVTCDAGRVRSWW
jgi:hypothetical protein